MQKTDAEWRRRLTPEQYGVLREHGTERAGTSPLNVEKRDGHVPTASAAARPCSPSELECECFKRLAEFLPAASRAPVETTGR